MKNQLMVLCLFLWSGLHAELINDIHLLNETEIYQRVVPRAYSEIKQTLEHARAHGLKVSIAGVRHSQGGQQFCPDAIVIDMTQLKRIISLDTVHKTVTVQAGITWKELQEYLNKYDLALLCMQHLNRFTLGGSLAVNCHGPDVHASILIDTIESFKIMLSDGSVVDASRTQNPELFASAIGGYGLFGVILEATIKVTDNVLLKKSSHFMPIAGYFAQLPKLLANSSLVFHHAYLSTSKNRLFTDVLTVNHTKSKKTKKIREKLQNPNRGHHSWFTRLWRTYDFVKQVHFPFIKTFLEPSQTRLSRNNAMRYNATDLKFDDPEYANILQEYFIPVNHMPEFLKELSKLVLDHDINLMTAIMRYLPVNRYATLSYARNESLSIVLYITVPRASSDQEKCKLWTQQVIDLAAQYQGAFYLVAQPLATRAQVYAAYPELERLMQLKKKYDPLALFSNTLYNTYCSN